ncbi:transcriptional regulator, LacI family [Rhizobiales bacterium GAS191]|jgi:LacI family transcriptional regulator|nr:transcriptional regulator, LacI family [Rhizobiales bacterium GAS113]SEC41407.1 transcriptional regulator, LacI family [Rhizobiales bacterium GAS188]SEC85971.1 transcriptional regulator, LacI family [Rhizobiales bacterium GAS191]
MPKEPSLPHDGSASPVALSKSATLLGVAQAAGVSTATVARVLHSRGYVAKETRSRVEAAIKAAGYSLNAVARGLRTRRTHTLGHLLSYMTYNPFFAGIASGVDDDAFAKGYKVFNVNLEGNREREHKGVTQLIQSRVDALIFSHAVDAGNVALAMAAGIPVVQVERLVDCPTHAVVVDNLIGCRQAMQHLIGLGHRRIAFVGADPARYVHAGPRPQSIENERLSAYVDCLRQAGISVDRDLVFLSTYPRRSGFPVAPGEHGAGYEPMRRFLGLPERPTAVLVTGDVFATGLLQALYEAKLRVPDDISVIGYDDMLAPHLAPPLTAVALPAWELGRTACELALRAIGADLERQVVVLPTRLNIRASTGLVPSSRAVR